MIETSRRGLLAGLGALIAAPAIVRATSVMPVMSLDLMDDPVMSLDLMDLGNSSACWREVWAKVADEIARPPVILLPSGRCAPMPRSYAGYEVRVLGKVGESR